MKLSEFKTLPVEDERPHQPQVHPLWQESVVMTFQDVEQRVGGFMRIGHWPNDGRANCAFGIVTKELCYNRFNPRTVYREGDRFATGFRVDNFLSAEFDAHRNQWVAEDEHCSLDIQIENLHPLMDSWELMRASGDFLEQFAKRHTEVAGLARGQVRIGDKTWTISGYAYRDHSWGIRDLGHVSARIANFFWLIGSCGPNLIFGMSDVITAAGARNVMGYIIKDGKVEKPVVEDASFEIELDGVSLRSAQFKISTETLGNFDVEFEGFGNVLLSLGHEYLESATPGIARWNGVSGGAHVSTMFNARGGNELPQTFIDTTAQNGIYRKEGFRHLVGAK
jgi:hypothetical protein